MSILSVDQIQPIGSGTTITLNATEVKTGTEITVGTGASIFSPAGNTLTFGTNNVERIRIKNDGTVLIGTSTEGISNADDLTIATSGHTGLTIRSGTSNQGNIFFSDGTSGADEYRGYLQYEHTANTLIFGTDAVERLRINSSGDVGIGTVSPQSGGLTVLRNSEARLQVWANGDGSNGKVALRADGNNTQIGTWSNHDCKLVRNSTIQASISSNGISFPAGKGIDFSATSDATGVTSELFDDYERGAHVISVLGSNSNPSITLSANHKRLYYTKIGSMVHVTGELRWTINSHGSGDLRITLPFQSDSSASSNSHGTAQTWNVNWAWRSETRDIWSEVYPGQSFLVFRLGGSGSLNEDFLQLGSSYQSTANSGYGVEYQVSLWYRTG